MLVDNDADVNARQQQGWTPLHGAAQSGDRDLVKLLLAKGADREARADTGQTALDLAMTHGHGAVAALLEA
jgi:ankyrin repeat protein